MHYAHSANDIGNWHPLAVHLGSVAHLAKAFASESAWRDEAHLAGLLHDLGKYADRFQRRLHGEESGLDHWSQGASLALTNRAIAAALAIQGHHVGLQRGDKDTLKRLQHATTIFRKCCAKLRATSHCFNPWLRCCLTNSGSRLSEKR